ncbi:hypothetical protein EDC01DRAFT_655795, partial [Geopyxis carbonaria]
MHSTHVSLLALIVSLFIILFTDSIIHLRQNLFESTPFACSMGSQAGAVYQRLGDPNPRRLNREESSSCVPTQESDQRL